MAEVLTQSPTRTGPETESRRVERGPEGFGRFYRSPWSPWRSPRASPGRKPKRRIWNECQSEHFEAKRAHASPDAVASARLALSLGLTATASAQPAFLASVKGINPKGHTQCPSTEFCGTASIAGYGTATWRINKIVTTPVSSGICLRTGLVPAFTYTATTTFVLGVRESSTLVLDEHGLVCAPGNSASAQALTPSFGAREYANNSSWTVDPHLRADWSVQRTGRRQWDRRPALRWGAYLWHLQWDIGARRFQLVPIGNTRAVGSETARTHSEDRLFTSRSSRPGTMPPIRSRRSLASGLIESRRRRGYRPRRQPAQSTRPHRAEHADRPLVNGLFGRLPHKP